MRRPKLKPYAGGQSIAVEWEHKIPGITEELLNRARENPDSTVLRTMLDFLRWEPNDHDRTKMDWMRRTRSNPRAAYRCPCGRRYRPPDTGQLLPLCPCGLEQPLTPRTSG